MPYIKQEKRKQFEQGLSLLIDKLAADPDGIAGNLNYVITSLINGITPKNYTPYTAYNGCIGVLECVKLEMYRRTVGPYEDVKCRENGDVA